MKLVQSLACSMLIKRAIFRPIYIVCVELVHVRSELYSLPFPIRTENKCKLYHRLVLLMWAQGQCSCRLWAVCLSNGARLLRWPSVSFRCIVQVINATFLFPVIYTGGQPGRFFFLSLPSRLKKKQQRKKIRLRKNARRCVTGSKSDGPIRRRLD